MSTTRFIDRGALQRWHLFGSVMICAALIVFGNVPQKSAHRGYRRVEARLTSEDYAPFFTAAVRDSSQTIAAEVAKTKLSKADHSPEVLQQLAQKSIKIDRPNTAIDYLSKAIALAPTNASILSDLAVAHLAVGSFADAAEAAASALHYDSSLTPAAFNWALALEGVSNRPAALRAWKRYLQLDGSSAWAYEARRHLDTLEAPRRTWEKDQELLRADATSATVRTVAERYPQRTRHWVQDELLLRIAERGEADDVRLASVVAETRSRHDPFLRDVLEHVRNAPDRARLVGAIKEFREGRAAAELHDVEGAADHFARAAMLLEHTGSPLAHEAHIFAATHDSYCGRGEKALERLQQVHESLRSGSGRYPAIAAELDWIRGLVLSTLGRNDDAFTAYRVAIEFARRSSEVEQEVGIAALIATALDTVGDQAEAERYRAEILRQLDDVGGSRHRAYTIYARAALSAIAAKRPRLALAFTDTQHELARQENNPMLFAEVATARAMACLELHQLDRAALLIEVARQNSAAVTPQAMRDRTLANLEFIHGKIELQRDPRRARDAFTAGLSIWERYGWRRHTAMGRLFRARSYARMGDRRLAETDLRAAIEEVERQRKDLGEPPLRVGYFERADNLFDELVELLLDEGRDRDALAIAEQKRCRALLDVLATENRDAPGRGRPLLPSEIAAALPEGVVILQFALLDERMEIWLIRRGDIIRVHSGIARNQFEQAVERHLAAIETDDERSTQTEGRWLYDQLIAPVERYVAEGTLLVVVPDGRLHAVPFAALIAPDGRYLVERAAVTIAPSATFFIRAAKEASTLGHLVAVAQPSPAGLTPLRYASREVQEVARLYPSAAVFISDNVSGSELLRAAETAAVIHFAGHAATDFARPNRSALLFGSAEHARAAELTAGQIASAKFKRSPLVVLAACETGAGKVRRMEGVDSLAAAFLTAGARTVAATLWDVDDDKTSRLLLTFHRALRTGDSPADALRNAQISFIRSGSDSDRQPRSWAGVFLAGSSK